jgi:D-beta-D-heptose 7-phosphate kinase/D-beta-D-heptose 1-phosphate adenosyltransferase
VRYHDARKLRSERGILNRVVGQSLDNMSIVENFAGVNVLCIGDVMMDQFTGGAIRRVSPESPVLIFSVESRKRFPGGAANVARNIAALGGRCTLIGAIGDDSSGRDLSEDLTATVGISPVLIACRDRPTTEKNRYVAQGQHVLRVDEEVSSPLSDTDEKNLIAAIAKAMPGHQAVILSDYAKGVLADGVIRQTVNLAGQLGLPVIVDPKTRDFSRYRGATVITPNAKEIEAASGIEPINDAEAARAAGHVMQASRVAAILVTRAEQGMTLVRSGAKPIHIPSAAREVYDVVGAGDTVIATLSLAVGAGADLADACYLANVAAGISVSRRGTSTVSQGDLINALSNTGAAKAAPHLAKVMNPRNASLRVDAWKKDGEKIVFTNGCFDILHLGHIRLLDFARGNGDRLVVGVNADASVRRLKGPTRPINDENDRAELLAALSAVDAVIVFGEDTPQALIEALKPDVLIKGADYSVEQIVGAEFVLANGGKVVRFDILPGKSTTNIINQAGGRK